MKRKFILLLAILLTAIAHADNQDSYPFTSLAETKRFETLTKETRCVVCQNQNLAESNAPLAKDLRQKIYNMMIQKKSDAEIKAYLVSRYGEFILLRPLFNLSTLFLWTFPLLGLALIFVFLKRTYYNPRGRR